MRTALPSHTRFLAAFLALSALLPLTPPAFGQGSCPPPLRLTDSAGQPFDRFGSVALFKDTLVVGALTDDHPSGGPVDAGSAYVFVRNGTDWSYQDALRANGAAGGDALGLRVAVFEDTAIVGAHLDDHGTPVLTDAGAAYVFVRSGTSWTQQAMLTASNAAIGDEFGYSVALHEDTAVVGAIKNSNANGIEAGATYVFQRSGTSWSEQAILLTSNGNAGDEFGSSVSVDGDVLAATSPGTAAYVFRRSGTTWTEQAMLIGQNSNPSVDYYAWQVAVSGATVAVTSPEHQHVGTGSVYVFVDGASGWSEQQWVTANDAALSDEFGESVALWQDTLVVGADDDEHSGVPDAGSAYVFTRTGTVWSQRAKLVTDPPSGEDEFGWQVAVWDGTVAVGALEDDHAAGMDAGSAYVFEWLPDVTTYCTAKSPLVCGLPAIDRSGCSSAGAASGFTISAAPARGGRVGVLLYSNAGRAAIPFQGGTLCINPAPLRRAVPVNSGGTPGQCDGVFALDMNCFAAGSCGGNPEAFLAQVGERINCQFWGRDSVATGSFLSDALEYWVGP